MKAINNTIVTDGFAVLTKDSEKGIFVNYKTFTYTYFLTDNIEKVTLFKAKFQAENVKQHYLDSHKKPIELVIKPVKVTTRHQVDLEEIIEEEIGGIVRWN